MNVTSDQNRKDGRLVETVAVRYGSSVHILRQITTAIQHSYFCRKLTEKFRCGKKKRIYFFAKLKIFLFSVETGRVEAIGSGRHFQSECRKLSGRNCRIF